jgi:hypothetical protein
MPDELRSLDRDEDPYAWVRRQAMLLGKEREALRAAGIDIDGLRTFLDETADEMLSKVTSQLVNLMAHAAKAAWTTNPGVVGHWRSECIEFHDRVVADYRNSMRRRINVEELWRRASRKLRASFADHGERLPEIPATSPFTFDGLIDPELDIERLVRRLSAQTKRAG